MKFAENLYFRYIEKLLLFVYQQQTKKWNLSCEVAKITKNAAKVIKTLKITEFLIANKFWEISTFFFYWTALIAVQLHCVY